MSASAFCATVTRARAAMQRLVLLLGAVPRDVVLALGRLHLRALLIELRLRHQLPVVQQLGALEIRLRASTWVACALATSGTLFTSKADAVGDAEPGLDLRGVGLRLASPAPRPRRRRCE